MKAASKFELLKLLVFVGVILFFLHKLKAGLICFVVSLVLRYAVFCRCPHCHKVIPNAFQGGSTCPICGGEIK